MNVSFACPQCRQTLRVAQALPPGQTVKCPACSYVFTPPPPPVGSDPTTAQERPSATPSFRGPEPERFERTPRSPEPEPYARPPASREPERFERTPVPPEPQPYGYAPTSRDPGAHGRGPAPRDRYDDDYAGSGAGRKKKGSLLVFAGLITLLVIVVVGVGGFIWPGFLRSGGKNYSDLVAYLPEKYDVLVGMDVSGLRARKAIMDLVEKSIKEQGEGADAKMNFIKSADRALTAVTIDGQQMVLVLSTTTAQPADKIREIFKAGKAETVNGKTVYPTDQDGEQGWLGLPNDRTIVLGKLATKEDFAKLLDGKGKLSASMEGLVREVSSGTLWVAVSVEGDLKEKMKNMGPKDLGPAALVPGIGPALQSATGFAASLDLSRGARLQVALNCASDKDAAAIHKTLTDFKPMITDGLSALAKVQPEMKSLADEVNGTLEFRQRGTRVTASVQVSEATWGKLEKDIEKMPLPLAAFKPAEPVDEGGPSVEVEMNLREVARALEFYRGEFKRFPAQAFSDSKEKPVPNLSWRVAILPQLGRKDLYDRFKLNEPWNSPHNMQLLDQMPNFFAPVGKQPKSQKGGTYLQLVTGPGTLYPTATASPTPENLGRGEHTLLLVVESAVPVPWTKPEDVHYQPKGPLPRLGAVSPKGFYAALASTDIHFVNRAKCKESTIRWAIDPNDKREKPFDWPPR